MFVSGAIFSHRAGVCRVLKKFVQFDDDRG